jgi:hypothetical protein
MQNSSQVQVQAKVVLATERRFFAWLSVAVLVMTVVGFLNTYLLVPAIGLPKDALPPTPLVHIHAFIFFAWCVLLVAQAWLVISNRTPHHKQLGLLGLALYFGLVVTGPLVAVSSAIRYGGSTDELAFLAVSLGNVVAYTAILGAAFHWRRRPDIHKRLMLVGMVALLTAPFGRLVPFPYLLEHVVGPSFVVIALAIWDYSAYGRLHFVTKVVGPAVLLWELLPNLYMNSQWWLTFTRWLLKVAA